MRKISSFSIRYLFITPIVFLALAVSSFAQQPFNKNEFVQRRAKLFEKSRMALLCSSPRKDSTIR